MRMGTMFRIMSLELKTLDLNVNRAHSVWLVESRGHITAMTLGWEFLVLRTSMMALHESSEEMILCTLSSRVVFILCQPQPNDPILVLLASVSSTPQDELAVQLTSSLYPQHNAAGMFTCSRIWERLMRGASHPVELHIYSSSSPLILRTLPSL
mmetsp:Transcript_46826/g.146800  ORF Transcript_46826/g.146800 Transcript_46826/m.146800 type:complete len:154 (+) Transcript_46826:2648-3109(+)